jgi:hypothetical protein
MPLGTSLSPDVIAKFIAAVNELPPVENKVEKSYASWLFTKPAARAIPEVRRPDWVRNPIDNFILAKLESKGLQPAPSAGKRTLIRRLYFDLVGLPPSPDEVDSFLEDDSPDAYEKLIDKLLADARYGERWARHWLDLARYAESDGFAIDGERPTAWRYRDYVIRSFNEDKPYNQFVKEQIAGDEMREGVAAGKRSERLVALGFLRMGTWEADANFKTQLRQDVLNDTTSTVAQVFLGMTVGCARCHDHKYDPIPQRDFYRLQAFFAPMRVEERPAPFLQEEHPKQMKQLFRDFEDRAETAQENFKSIESEMKAKYVAVKNLKPDAKEAGEFTKALRDRKDPLFTEEDRKRYEAARNEARRLNESIPRYRSVAYSVSDVTPPHVPALPDTYVLAGGELANKGEKVEPGFLEAVTHGREPARIPFAGGSSGRRTALADWIASPDNPLTARVMANRVWYRHFSQGIVRTPSDFGLNGDRPSHPELLDWLATQFIEKKWSIKSLHRLILTSNTYRQSTEHPNSKQYSDADPDNRLYWRMNWRRLEAETLRDSVLALSGRLNNEAGGPGVFLDIPDDVAEGFEFFKWFPSEEKDQLRRTIYTFQRRSVMNPMVEVFDGANMNESCSRRNITTVAPQAFTLLNGEFTNREAGHFANRVVEFAGPNLEAQVETAFRLVLSRSPSAAEKAEALELLRSGDSKATLARLGLVLFNTNEFLYVE